MLALLRIVGGRLLAAVPLLIAVTFGTFVLLYSTGDVASAVAGENASAAQIALIRKDLGLDRSVFIQYFHWITGLFQGDLGDSFRSGRSVTDLIGQRIGTTISLAVVALVISLAISVPAAFLGSRFPGSLVDRFTQVGSIIGLSIPNFFLGLVVVLFFAVQLRWLPSSGYSNLADGFGPWLQHLLLPSATLGLAIAGEQARTFRASLRKELDADYIRTARAKNVPERVLLTRHAGRNAALPLITVVGLQVGRLLGGAVLIEAVFALPGLGGLMTEAVFTKDLPIVQAVILLSGIVVLLMSLLVDLSYGVLNPSVRRKS